MSKFKVKKVAVLGAGVMGAQLAAQLLNSQVPVLLFDLAAPDAPSQTAGKNAIVSRAVEALKKTKPAALGLAADAALIGQANYEQHLELLRTCDVVIEAIAERIDFKCALYQKIAPFIAPHAILASNTSGLSMAQLSQALPEHIRPRFCGVHFFNPPRYMRLVELIAAPQTAPHLLDDLETFITSTLGKNVVRAKDTPNFIANRLGVAGLLSTMHEAQNFGLSFDVVDDLTGKKLGRANSGTFRTADVVGLDTLAHVIKTLQDTLCADPNAGAAKFDPFYASFAIPETLSTLLAMGHLGQKTKAGFFKKVGAEILRFDLASKDYVPAGAKADEVYARMLKKPALQRLQLLRSSQGAQGRFLWAVLRNSFHYAAWHLAEIADNARDVDFCMRWGFGMQQGPFELWQEAGWQAVANMVQEDIDAGVALCRAPLPSWVFDPIVLSAGGVHTAHGSYSAARGQFVAPTSLPVYQRQYFPPGVFGAGAPNAAIAGTTLFESEVLRLWTLDDAVLIASIKSKMCTLSPALMDGLVQALDLAEANYQALVIWSPGDLFSVGADLQAMLPAFMTGGVAAIGQAQEQMQRAMLRLRYANVPVVAALRGLALGGGCELALHCAQRVAAFESYIGLVEVGVGLVPGAGGLTYVARRAFETAAAANSTELLAFLKEGFTAVAMAKVASSALEARQLGYLLPGDVIVAHPDELLHVALSQAKALAQAGYRAPMARPFAVLGRSGIATIKAQLLNLRDGGFISAHDFHIASLIASVVCGGDVDAGSLVTEDYLMALERQTFCALLGHSKTQERIMAMLSSGKPLRN